MRSHFFQVKYVLKFTFVCTKLLLHIPRILRVPEANIQVHVYQTLRHMGIYLHVMCVYRAFGWRNWSFELPRYIIIVIGRQERERECVFVCVFGGSWLWLRNTESVVWLICGQSSICHLCLCLQYSDIPLSSNAKHPHVLASCATYQRISTEIKISRLIFQFFFLPKYEICHYISTGNSC